MINTILKYNAIIFGGAVRDVLLHDFNATEFYKMNQSNMSYDDPLNLPKTADRLIVLNDIDFMIKEEDFVKLKEHMEKTWFIRRNSKVIDMAYKLECEKGEYMLYKYDVLVNNNIIKLDIVVSVGNKVLTIPFMDPDCDVNRVLYSKKRKYYLRDSENSTSLFNIIFNIKNKVAYCETNIKSYRFYKMSQKGWNITINYNIYKFIKCILNDKCIVCHEDFNEDFVKKNKYSVQFVKCNCNYSICYACIKQNWKNITKCVMCRKEYFTDETEPTQDFDLFHRLQIHTK